MYFWFGVVNNVYAETSVNTDVPSYEQNTSKVNGIINNTNILPVPMTYADALIYQQKNKDDITLHLDTYKDVDGNKKISFL